MIEPNILAFQNGDLLAALDAPPADGWGRAALAAHIGRDPSNTSRALKALAEAGLVSEAALTAALTEEGKAQLAAFNRARHGVAAAGDPEGATGDAQDQDGERRKAQGRWDIHQLQRNPANRIIGEADVEGMADAIAGVGDILLPLVLSPPDANGVRTIWAGERRWKGALLLDVRGELPEALAQGVPFVERQATEGEAALIAVIENTARKDLTPWEDALLLKAAADGLGVSNASELARRIGRAREGDRGGLRDVQEKLKVAREATPEAIAEYERNGSWDQLRDSVKTSRPTPAPAADIVTTKAQRLALAELWRKAGRTLDEVAILPAGHSAEGARLAQYGLAILSRSDQGDTARVTKAGVEYLAAEGLNGSIENARASLGYPEGYGVARFRTEWLNTPGDDNPWLRGGWVHVQTRNAPAASVGAQVRDASLALFRQSDGFNDRYRVRFHVELWDRTVHVNDPIPGPSSSALAYQMAIEDFLKHAWPDAPRALIEWADRIAGPFVVAGKDYFNAARAQEARYARGWDQRKANSGGGAKAGLDVGESSDRAADIPAPADPVLDPAGDPPWDDAPPPAAVMSAHLRALAESREHPTNAALRLIAEERRRQVEKEGWSPDHDDQENSESELALAAAAYCAAYTGDPDAALFWPSGWDSRMFKPQGDIHDLVRAGALIAAELERRARQAMTGTC